MMASLSMNATTSCYANLKVRMVHSCASPEYPEYEWQFLDIRVSNMVWLACVCVRAIEIGGRSATAVAVGRGEQQQKVVQAPALRQPLSPVVTSVTQQQIYVEDSGNRLQVSNNN
jgi:hypothetical protein